MSATRRRRLERLLLGYVLEDEPVGWHADVKVEPRGQASNSSSYLLLRPHTVAIRLELPFRWCSPRSSNSIPVPATRSLTVLETSTSPGCAFAATLAPVHGNSGHLSLY